MPRILKPLAPLDLAPGERSVFLAGSIEMGRAEPWQAEAEQALADLPVCVLNPRREEWDASWEQSMADERFAGQVRWELEALERATLIAMHFVPSTQSPITLLELGLWARSGKLLVSCPPGFWRRGNVEAVCERYGVSLFAELGELLRAIRSRV